MALPAIKFQKQHILGAAGVLLLLFSIFAFQMYLNNKTKDIYERAKKDAQQEITRFRTSQTSVLVAKQAIPAGTLITADKFDAAVVQEADRLPRAISSASSIEGMIAAEDIAAGEQLTKDKVGYADTKRSLADATPIGKRAITIAVDNISSLVGMVKPGDRVDVIATLNIPIQSPSSGAQTSQSVITPVFQNVLVLAVGQEVNALRSAADGRSRQAQPERRDTSPLITLALTPQEANLLAFVQEQGKIRLVLRSKIDAQTELMPPANWETFFQYVMPDALKKKDDRSKIPKVEIYRGLEKEVRELTE